MPTRLSPGKLMRCEAVALKAASSSSTCDMYGAVAQWSTIPAVESRHVHPSRPVLRSPKGSASPTSCIVYGTAASPARTSTLYGKAPYAKTVPSYTER